MKTFVKLSGKFLLDVRFLAVIIFTAFNAKILILTSFHRSICNSHNFKRFLELTYQTGSTYIYLPVAAKQADRQASRILKMRSSLPKNFGTPVFYVALGGPTGALRDNRPAASGLHPTVDERHGHGQQSTEARTHYMSKNWRICVSLVHWNTLSTIKLRAVLIVTANNVLFLIDYIIFT